MKNELLTTYGTYKEGLIIPNIKPSFTEIKRVLVVFLEEISNLKTNGMQLWNNLLLARGVWKDGQGITFTDKVREDSETRLKRFNL